MSASGPSVLVVDDHPPLREVVGEVLERAGCRVRLAATGEQALEVARREPVAASFLDVHMPGLDGFETALRLRRIRHDMPLVFVTASASETDRRRGEAMACFAWVTKPVTAGHLLAVVERLFRAFPAPGWGFDARVN